MDVHISTKPIWLNLKEKIENKLTTQLDLLTNKPFQHLRRYISNISLSVAGEDSLIK